MVSTRRASERINYPPRPGLMNASSNEENLYAAECILSLINSFGTLADLIEDTGNPRRKSSFTLSSLLSLLGSETQTINLTSSGGQVDSKRENLINAVVDSANGLSREFETHRSKLMSETSPELTKMRMEVRQKLVLPAQKFVKKTPENPNTEYDKLDTSLKGIMEKTSELIKACVE